MLHDVSRVAIIGAGPTGVVMAKFLLAEETFQTIDIYEERASVGGIWNYSPLSPLDGTDVPQTDPHQPIEEPIWRNSWEKHFGSNSETRVATFSSPMYDGLETNIPHLLMRHSDKPFPHGTQLFPRLETVSKYLQEYADDVKHLIRFQTQVIDVIQRGRNQTDAWLVKRKDLVSNEITESSYDAVAVASGHYSVPCLPEIKGIKEWNETYQGIISHSKFFRRPDFYKDKKVVVVGNSASGLDIGCRIATVCRHPLLCSQRSKSQFTTGGASNTEAVPEIAEFLPVSLFNKAVRFADGRIEAEIDAILFCTGYFYSFPFLSSIQPLLIEDGTRVHHLYEHIFYIQDPSLAFLGIPKKVSPFPLCECQAAVIARVWSNRLELPSPGQMYEWEKRVVGKHGNSSRFHEMAFPIDLEYQSALHDWGLSSLRPEHGKVPYRWSKKQEWIRERFPEIKKAFAERGEGRHKVRTIEELGFNYEKWLREQQREMSLLQSPEDTTSHQSTDCKVKAIIGEKPGQYLIEWKDDPLTGEKYSSDWQPKTRADAAAVTARYQQKKLGKREHNSRQFRPEKFTTETRDQKIRDTLPQPFVDTSLSLSGQSNFLQLGQKIDRLTLPSATSPPGLIVHISQHSSFDRDQYIQYSSSLSVQAISQSLVHEQASSEIYFSPPQAISEPTSSGPQRVIPDSQSLPGSSSYIPTSSKSESSYWPTQALTENRSLSLPESPSQGLRHFATQLSETIEYTPDSIAAVKQSPSAFSGRSISVELRASIALRDSVLLQDSEKTEKASLGELKDPTNTSSSISAPRSIISDSQKSRRSDWTPGAEHLAILNRSTEVFSIQSSLTFQTRAPLVVDSQGSQDALATRPSTDHWQSAQVVLESTNSASQSSSGVVEDISVSVRNRETSTQALLVRKSPLSQASNSGQFVISEDPTHESQESPKAESSICSQRDPNSQLEKNPHSAQAKDDTALPSTEDSDLTTDNVSSSLEPTVPFRLPETFDSRVPSRPSSPSEINMSDHSETLASTSPKVLQPSRSSGGSVGMALREKLKNMRANSAANAAAQKANLDRSHSARSTKSPSAMTDKPISPDMKGLTSPATQSFEVPLAVRISQPDVDMPDSNGSNGDSETPQDEPQMYQDNAKNNADAAPISEEIQSSIISPDKEISYTSTKITLHAPVLGLMEFVVPLPMNPRVRDQYVSTIYYYRRAIETFLREEDPDDALLETIRTMMDRVNSVTSHVDLDNGGPATQQQESAEDEAVWAENCSKKFSFLSHLFEAARDQDRHIAVVARPGRLQDIIETFLKGRCVVYTRPGTLSRSDPSIAKGRLQVSLIATGKEGAIALPRAASLVIAFDGSFNPQDVQIGILRAHVLNVGQLSPVVHLLVYNSAEHIERCLSGIMDPISRLQRVVNCMTQTRNEVGQMGPDENSPPAAAEEVAAFLEAGGQEDQWALPSIRAIEGIEIIEPSQDQESSTQSDVQPSIDQVVTPPLLTLKRPLNVEEDISTPKRQRLTPALDVDLAGDLITQASQATETIANLGASLQEAKSELTALKTSHMEREKTLQALVSTTQQRLEEHINDLSTLQIRYESRTAAYHVLRHEKTDLLAAATIANRKREALATELGILKDDRSRLETELNQARAALSDSTIPGIADLENANTDARTVRAEKSILEKKLASLTKDFDFTRQQYQQASTAAATSASHLTDLEAELAALRPKAAGEALKLRIQNDRTDNEVHVRRIRALEATLLERDELLRKKEEEIREMRRGRGVQTRGNSVQPRSPRLGNGSRGGSPVPGLLGFGKGGSALRYG